MASHSLARLERTPCFGWCPVYEVEIDIDGGVTYQGRDYVMTHGSATGELTDDQLRSLRAAVLRSRRVQMPGEQCACGCVTDIPYVELTTWDEGVRRTVRYDEGCEFVPPAIQALEREIDRVVDIERWIGTREARDKCFVQQRD